MSLARVYAKALYETAKGKGSGNGAGSSHLVLDREREELAYFAEMLNLSEDLRRVLFGPSVSSKEKVAVVRELSKRAGFSDLIGNFLALLAKKGRLAWLEQIKDSLEEVRLNAEGGVVGQLVSADPVDPKDVAQMEKAFENKLGKKVLLKVSTDPSLLAGIKVSVGGVTYDGTLRAQLARLRDQFVHHRSEGVVQ